MGEKAWYLSLFRNKLCSLGAKGYRRSREVLQQFDDDIYKNQPLTKLLYNYLNGSLNRRTTCGIKL